MIISISISILILNKSTHASWDLVMNDVLFFFPADIIYLYLYLSIYRLGALGFVVGWGWAALALLLVSVRRGDSAPASTAT